MSPELELALLRLGGTLLLLTFLLLALWRLRQGLEGVPAPPPRGGPVLRVLEPGATGLRPGQTLPLGRRILLGRAGDATYVLADPAVSRHHALLEVIEGRIWLQDLGSANGTFVDGVRVEGRVELTDGQELALGGVRLRLEAE